MDEELWAAVCNFVESCHRTGLHDTEKMIDEFMVENDHMGLERYVVADLFHQANY